MFYFGTETDFTVWITGSQNPAEFNTKPEISFTDTLELTFFESQPINLTRSKFTIEEKF